MSTLVRSAKALPPELDNVAAWKARLSSEPSHIVLADAYEYNLWSLDENGVPTITEHPLHETTIENFLHSSSDAYAGAIVEVLRRRGHNPYERLMEDMRLAGVPDSALGTMSVCLNRVEGAARAERALAASVR